MTVFRTDDQGEVLAHCRSIRAVLGCALRAPHHTAGPKAVAGELELAAGGVLLLDEAADFRRACFEELARRVASRVLRGKPLPLAIVLRVDADPSELERLARVASSILHPDDVEALRREPTASNRTWR